MGSSMELEHPVAYGLLRSNRYGVIDPLMVEELPAGFPATRIAPTWLRGQEDHLPWLVRLDGGKLELHELATRIECEITSNSLPCVPLLISTHASEQELLAHLTTRLTLRLHSRRSLLRYYDPRVLFHLGWMWSAPELAWLLGPIQRVSHWCFDRWRVLDRPDQGPTAPVVAAKSLGSIGAINEILTSLGGGGESSVLEETSRRIERELLHAEAYGLSDETDRIAFASHALDLGSGFDRHPRVAALLSIESDAGGYRDRAGLISDTVWAEIRADLSKCQKTRKVP